MWILSRDRQRAVNANDLMVTRNFIGSKNEKYAIVATVHGGSEVILATYPDEKTASDSLEKAFSAIDQGVHTYKFD
ncbi:MAG: hypothetical protein K2J77_11185 [Oscillospiraceae bacterium]|nr:hypothetical protein [Oscillospiraceae bacterium]